MVTNTNVPHKVVSIEDRPNLLIKVTCSCGYWQQTRRLAYFEKLWIANHKDLVPAGGKWED